MDGCVSQGRRSRERAPSTGWRSHAREDVSILFSENLRRSFLRWPTLLTFMSLRSGGRIGRETKAKGRGESQSWRGRKGGGGRGLTFHRQVGERSELDLVERKVWNVVLHLALPENLCGRWFVRREGAGAKEGQDDRGEREEDGKGRDEGVGHSPQTFSSTPNSYHSCRTTWLLAGACIWCLFSLMFTITRGGAGDVLLVACVAMADSLTSSPRSESSSTSAAAGCSFTVSSPYSTSADSFMFFFEGKHPVPDCAFPISSRCSLASLPVLSRAVLSVRERVGSARYGKGKERASER